MSPGFGPFRAPADCVEQSMRMFGWLHARATSILSRHGCCQPAGLRVNTSGPEERRSMYTQWFTTGEQWRQRYLDVYRARDGGYGYIITQPMAPLACNMLSDPWEPCMHHNASQMRHQNAGRCENYYEYETMNI